MSRLMATLALAAAPLILMGEGPVGATPLERTEPGGAVIATPFDYDDSLKRLQAGDTSVDYRALRMASTKRSGFSGYRRFNLATASQLADAGDFKALRTMAEDHLKGEYLDPNAHFWLARACRQLKDESCTSFHLKIREGLLRSIMDSGDGASPETAFSVIGTDEEYAILRAAGLRSDGQSLSMEKGGIFDVLHTLDKDGARKDIWFDIAAFFGTN